MDPNDWAVELTPPPGGLVALNARLAVRLRRRRWVAGLAMATVAAVVVIGLARPSPRPQRAAWDVDPVLAFLDGPARRGVFVDPAVRDRLVVQPVEVQANGIVMVRVASTVTPSSTRAR